MSRFADRGPLLWDVQITRDVSGVNPFRTTGSLGEHLNARTRIAPNLPRVTPIFDHTIEESDFRCPRRVKGEKLESNSIPQRADSGGACVANQSEHSAARAPMQPNAELAAPSSLHVVTTLDAAFAGRT